MDKQQFNKTFDKEMEGGKLILYIQQLQEIELLKSVNRKLKEQVKELEKEKNSKFEKYMEARENSDKLYEERDKLYEKINRLEQVNKEANEYINKFDFKYLRARNEELSKLKRSLYCHCSKEMLEDRMIDEKIMNDNWNKFIDDADVVENLYGDYLELVEDEWNSWKNESCSLGSED